MSTDDELSHGGEALVRAICEEGCEYVFGICGGEMLPFLQAIDKREKTVGDIKYISVRHEQGGAHMADAYSRISDKSKIGVCCGTVGPGFANMVPGVACAYYDNVPILVVHPQMNKKFEDHGRLQQGINQMDMTKTVVKYQKSIDNPNRVVWGAQKCFKALFSGRPGPVQLEITEDAFYGKVEDYGMKTLKPHQYRNIKAPAANPELIDEVCKLLSESEKPLIVAGGGVVSSDAYDELNLLSSEFNIPACVSNMAVGAISSNSPNYLGATLGTGGVMKAARESDLILALGTRFAYTLGYGKPPVWNPEAKIIQVDIDPQSIGKNRPVNIGLLGDVKVVLSQIINKLKQDNISIPISMDWLNDLKKAREDAIKKDIRKMTTDRTPIFPLRVIHDLTKVAKPEDVIVVDGGDIAVVSTGVIDYITPRKPRTYMRSVGFGHLGTGIPYAIGAKLAKPDSNVFLLVGDGSFLFNIQELDTAVHYDIPFVAIVADNSSWGMIANAERRAFKTKNPFYTELQNRDYVSIAKGFGCYGEHITDPNEIIPAINRAIESKKPAVIQIPIKFVTPDNAKLLASFKSMDF
jgi:acetolactate synthase I/II/III large subunit